MTLPLLPEPARPETLASGSDLARSLLFTPLRNFKNGISDGWNAFWFQPADSSPLTLIRIGTGLLLFYSQIVWALSSPSFFGPSAWLSAAANESIRTSAWAVSPLWLVENNPALLCLTHLTAIISALLLTVGLYSRAAAVLSFLLTAAFANRNPAALYGFDQVLGLLTLYLCVHPGHDRLSLDQQRTRRTAQPSVSAGIALRLIQLHLCLLYAVAGLSKLKGAAWWSGVAFWGAVGSADYQTIDLTWLVHWPLLINLLTHLVLAWEVSYCVLIWNRLWRPVVLSLAAAVHLGIGLCFGMMPFGLAMLVANVAFVTSNCRVGRATVTSAGWVERPTCISLRDGPVTRAGGSR